MASYAKRLYIEQPDFRASGNLGWCLLLMFESLLATAGDRTMHLAAIMALVTRSASMREAVTFAVANAPRLVSIAGSEGRGAPSELREAFADVQGLIVPRDLLSPFTQRVQGR